MGFTVFVSHRFEDQLAAEKLVSLIETHGVPCWVAPRDLRLGTSNAEQVRAAIYRCQALVVFTVDSGSLSEGVLEEAITAARQQKPVFFVMLGSQSLSEGWSQLNKEMRRRWKYGAYELPVFPDHIHAPDGLNDTIGLRIASELKAQRRNGIFVSYRRADTEQIAGRLYDKLAQTFASNRVFFDVRSVPGGADFHAQIQSFMSSCCVCLAIIGTHWIPRRTRLLSMLPFVLLRLDHVAKELETARAMGVPILPILVNGAKMPTPLSMPAPFRPVSDINALTLRAGEDYFTDVDKIVKRIQEIVE